MFYLRQDVTEVATRATQIILECTTTGHKAAGVPPPISAEPQTTAPLETPAPEQNTLESTDIIAPAGDLDPVLPPLQGLQTANSDSEDLEEDEETARKLSEKEKLYISEEFQDWIQSTQTIYLEAVRFRLRNECSVLLKKLLVIKGMDVKVANRKRHCQTTVVTSFPEEQPNLTEIVQAWQNTQSVASADTVSSSRREWSEDDAAVLENLFGDESKCPARKDLEEKQQTSADLKELIERNTL